MKNKILTILIAILSCFCLSTLTEVLVFNFNILTLDNESKSLSEISYTIHTKDNQNTLNLDISNKYIHKLVIDYSSTKDTDYTVSYTKNSLYDQPETITINDVFDNLLSSSITNIDQTVTNISISYPKNANIAISKVSVNNNFSFNVTRMIIIALIFMLIFFLFYFHKLGFKTEKLHIYFAVVAGLLGTSVILAQPSATFYSYDDQIHFEKVASWPGGTIELTTGEYHMSNHNIENSVGRNAINSIEEQKLQNNFTNSNLDSSYILSSTSFPSYDKMPYLPMAIGYHTAKTIGLSFSICFKIGKLFNLLFYILLATYAIKTIKFGKRLLAVIALLPSSIFLASQYSYDPIVISGIMVFVAKLVNLYTDKTTKFDFKTACIIIGSITLTSFAKAIYAPLLLLTLFIPNSKFKNKKQAHLVKTGLISITLVLISTFILPSLSGNSVDDTRVSDASVNDQLSLIVSHPTSYLTILDHTGIDHFFNKLIGPGSVNQFAYIENPLISKDSNLFFILLILIIFVFFTDTSGNILSKKYRLPIVFICLAVMALIWTALYLSYNPVGNYDIVGVQDRYFLPLLFPLLLALQPKNIENKIRPSTYNFLVIAIPAIAMVLSIYFSILIPYSF